MQTFIATALSRGSVDEAAAALCASVKTQLAGHVPAFAVVFASVDHPLADLMPRLRAGLGCDLILGASSAGEFTEKGDTRGAVSLFAVAGDFKAFAGLGFGLGADAEAAVTQALAGLPSTVEGYPHKTSLVLLDTLTGKSEEAVLLTAALLGDATVRLAGGAAGDNLTMTRTWVGLGDRVASDAIVVATVFSARPLGVGVWHGHRVLSRPLKATRASGNVVYEIDGRPAWTVWAEMTREAARTRGEDPDTLTPDHVVPYLLRYPAGLATGGEYKIRAALSRGDDGSLSFACGIPEGAVFRVTEGEPQRQMDSAREAARLARAQSGETPAGALVFDCICRKLILGDAFGEAVRGISEELGGVPVAGFETYGEIALDAGDMSGFHNTTTVVLSFPQ